jgi:hypothetical protein
MQTSGTAPSLFRFDAVPSYVIENLSVMKTLILKKTSRHYGEPHWPDNDFVVLDGSRVVGRIMRHPQAAKERPWFWTITQGLPSRTYNRGYAATRLQAMVDFKARWLN